MQRSPSGDGSDLLAAIVDACHTAIDKVLAAPQEALGIAEGLSGTLATLRLVTGDDCMAPSRRRRESIGRF